MEPSVDVVELISNLLDTGKYKEALSVPNEQKHKDSFKDNCWDLISVIVGKLQDDTIIVKPSLHGACEQLLALIVEASTPEEALLELIEQVEVAKNDAQFGVILVPLQQLLKKLSVKRGRSLEWCLNSISTYIENIPIPEHHLEDKERLLMDCDTNIRRIAKVYSMLPPFYRPFIKELEQSHSNMKAKQIINAFLVSLLGKPLINIDLDPDNNAMSEARQCCSMIIQDICTLEKNIFRVIEYINICHKENQKSVKKANASNDDEIAPYEHREKINMTTLAGLAYTLFSGHFEVPDANIPQVYSAEYTVHTVMLSVVHLLSFTEYGLLAKGIALCNAILKHLPDNATQTLLACSVHFDLCKNLMNVAIYSQYEPLRKEAVKLIGLHINKFVYSGRIMLIKYLIETANHSGMIGYAITLYKNSIDLSLKDATLDKCFTGAQFMNMIKKICNLPHGAESDIVELADQIITSLNFLRYLALRDSENKTGIRDCFQMIESDYLEKLRTGLNMSKAHYEEKMKEIEEGKGLGNDTNISVNVGGNVLDNIPVENKKEIINSALNAFHLIEGLVARLSECININKMQALTMDCE
ncbi:glomulin-like isoform X1 [Ostrinia furnacalis]|uniref:glomulin-like isoform X1 n=1 Tax=Ostrinia furnacalis TaxID=93504 RepID=UPI001038A34B|nr:glomulin-like isoform X1 [Ostrinia furnacalis]